MRIRDIFENFNEELRHNVLDVTMMFLNNGVEETSIQNFVIELSKRGFNVIVEDLIAIFEELQDFSVEGENVVMAAQDSTDLSGELDYSGDNTEYNPATSKAKEALKKRM